MGFTFAIGAFPYATDPDSTMTATGGVTARAAATEEGLSETRVWRGERNMDVNDDNNKKGEGGGNMVDFRGAYMAYMMTLFSTHSLK